MKYLPLFLLSTAFLLLNSCHRNQQNPPTTHSNTEHKKHWSYDGEASPEHWAELSNEFIKCAEGHFQSPIDIETYAAQEHPGSILEFNYHPSPIDEVNNGHTIQANLEEENLLTANGHTYTLKQFHFHEPSEHHLDGIIYPMEMHLVHADSTGKLAVVGVFIKEGKGNAYLEEIWDVLPEHLNDHAHPQKRCDLVHLLPEEKPVYHYSGSLTTPPCTEGVEWFIMKEPITLSKTQIEKFRHLYHGNNRPIQAQEDRAIEVTTD